MEVLAAQSQREVVRSRHRTLAAMTAQTVEQGRFLGGRPPYGYRLVDAGPHPNRAHAAWGRRRQRLDPDPVAAPTVRWIFAERLTGRSVAGIARELNERGVLCPSATDPARNRHRSGQSWNLRSVAVILANPHANGVDAGRRADLAQTGHPGPTRDHPLRFGIASLPHDRPLDGVVREGCRPIASSGPGRQERNPSRCCVTSCPATPKGQTAPARASKLERFDDH